MRRRVNLAGFVGPTARGRMTISRQPDRPKGPGTRCHKRFDCAAYGAATDLHSGWMCSKNSLKNPGREPDLHGNQKCD